MDDLTIEGWRKTGDDQKSTPVGNISFHIDEELHLRLEQAEDQLQESHEPEILIDVDSQRLNLQTPADIGELSGCRFRVYLHQGDERGHFHLVANRAADGSLVYTNAVMVDQLG